MPGTGAITVAGTIKSQTGTISVVKKYSRVFTLVAVVLISGITLLLVASQVRRQIREIGLLLAVGARPWIIVAFFAIAAALIGTAGGIGGLLLGQPLTARAASRLLGESLPAAGGLAGSVLALTIGVSVTAAILPAGRAAGLDPTTVLSEV